MSGHDLFLSECWIDRYSRTMVLSYTVHLSVDTCHQSEMYQPVRNGTKWWAKIGSNSQPQKMTADMTHGHQMGFPLVPSDETMMKPCQSNRRRLLVRGRYFDPQTGFKIRPLSLVYFMLKVPNCCLHDQGTQGVFPNVKIILTRYLQT